MRLWTLHPKYLDPRGLCALWRETLLARQVLLGRTRGYRNHPQLERFRAQPDPPAAVATYLREIHAESLRRGYAFDASKLCNAEPTLMMTETEGQLRYEWNHLLNKLSDRSPSFFNLHRNLDLPEPHPLFRIKAGPVADWERLARERQV